MKSPRKNEGLIGLIVVIVVALIILGYFGFDIRKIIESPQVQKNLEYAWNVASTIWGEVWGLITYLAASLIDFIKELKEAISN